MTPETKAEMAKLADCFAGYASIAEKWQLDARGIFSGRRRAVLAERAFVYRVAEGMCRGRANGEYDDDYIDPLELADDVCRSLSDDMK